MKYMEITGNLFTVDSDYYLVHCISADFAMGAGIAVQFRNMGVKDALEKAFPYQDDYSNRWEGFGRCILVSGVDRYKGVFNLITKKRYFMKPTYQTLTEALVALRDGYLERKGNLDIKLAMPRIGCGLDKLDWEVVSKIIQDTFKDTNVEIVVYNYDED